MQNCLIEPDGDAKVVSGDGCVDVGSYFLGAEQAGLCRLYEQPAKADHCDALFTGNATEKTFIGKKPVRMVLYRP